MMKKLLLILLAVCFSFCPDLFAQSGIQTASMAFTPVSGDDMGSATEFVINQPLAKISSGAMMDLHIQDDYLRRSKQQKRTAWILLGSGVALIGTGIAVAYGQNDDAVESGISLLFISGSGVIASLVSIPFFVASARNKKKANSITSSVRLLQSPVIFQTGLRYKPCPGLTVKLQF